MTSAVTTTTRDGYWQAVRGVCILAVIWIHTVSGATYLDGPEPLNYHSWLVLRQVVDFPVAVFIFLAGYFVNTAKVHPVKPWLIERGWRLLLPFAVWSAVYTAILAIHSDMSWAKLGFNLITGRSAAHLYFILVLVQLVILTPLLVRAVRTRWWWALLGVPLLHATVLTALALTAGGLPPGYESVFTAWFAFYYVGLRVRHVAPSWPSPRVAIGLAAGALLVSVAAAYALITLGAPASWASSQLKISSQLYAFAIITLAFALKPQIPIASTGLLARIGDDSYGIYYVHMIWIIGLSPITKWIASATSVLVVAQLAQAVLTLILSIISMYVARRVLGRARAARWLGF